MTPIQILVLCADAGGISTRASWAKGTTSLSVSRPARGTPIDTNKVKYGLTKPFRRPRKCSKPHIDSTVTSTLHALSRVFAVVPPCILRRRGRRQIAACHQHPRKTGAPHFESLWLPVQTRCCSCLDSAKQNRSLAFTPGACKENTTL